MLFRKKFDGGVMILKSKLIGFVGIIIGNVRGMVVLDFEISMPLTNPFLLNELGEFLKISIHYGLNSLNPCFP